MSILENAKQVAKAVEEIHNLELYQRVLALHSDIIDLVEENNRLRKEKEGLTHTLAIQKVMVFKDPFYFQEGDDTPYCAACWNDKHKAIHVVFNYSGNNKDYWDCPVCKFQYKVRSSNPTPAEPAHARLRYRGRHSWI